MFYRLTIFLYSSIFMIRFCVFCVFRCPAPKWGFFLIARLMTSSNASVSSISDWSRRSVESRLSVQSGFTAVKPILSSPIVDTSLRSRHSDRSCPDTDCSRCCQFRYLPISFVHFRCRIGASFFALDSTTPIVVVVVVVVVTVSSRACWVWKFLKIFSS